MIQIFLVSFLFPLNLLFSQTTIFSSNGEKANFQAIQNQFNQSQVLILGEEHNDKTGHQWKLELIKSFSHNVKFSISMEMLERDQQIIIDEYLQSLYDEAMFRENMRLWNNWNDYHPILEFAKESKIKVLAANPPRRYVRAISRKGIQTWGQFSGVAYLYLPNLELVQKFREKEYEVKFQSILGNSHTTSVENFLLAQHIWDESMAEVIFREVTNFKTKVIHINGRFHSDNFLGVTYRLKQRGISVTTVSIVPEVNFQTLVDWKNLADFIVVTKPN